MAVLWLTALIAPASPVAASGAARVAIVRALPILQRSAATFVDKRACFSCHHNALPIMMLRLADRHGVAVDRNVLTRVEAKTFRTLTDASLDDAVQAVGVSDPTPNDSLLLVAAHDARLPPNLTTAVVARRLVHWQRPNGQWMTSDFRPPHSSSNFTATATALRAIRSYMAPELSGERDAAVKRAAAWLTASWPHSTEDAAFRLLGLVWADAPPETITAASRVLLSMQVTGGGWPELPGDPADAYSTGEALYALSASGVPTSTPEWTKGERFLVTTQAPDGTWRVHTRMISPAEVSPPYFSTGFPYRKDEYLSYAGTCWAVMALLSSLPGSQPTVPAASAPVSNNIPSWIRTALFGSAGDLTGLLDAGLDGNSTTARGTTPLMAAVLDPEKVRLLLARHADVRARGQSGMDALTIAASFFGTSESIGALLDAGAAIQAPDGVHVRRTPIVAASLAGDPDTVQLLLRRGARPSAEALSEAITFGYTDVVRTLVEAGADAGGVDRTGINLLHWATITNRATLIPVLARAGVPVNAIDEAGFTPLMYAATIDQGDTDALEALLRAGADVRIRNADGRTALQQAEHLRLADVVRVLRASAR